METNECISAPCQNGGTCIDNQSSYVCLCLPDYTGYSCEEKIDECKSIYKLSTVCTTIGEI